MLKVKHSTTVISLFILGILTIRINSQSFEDSDLFIWSEGFSDETENNLSAEEELFMEQSEFDIYEEPVEEDIIEEEFIITAIEQNNYLQKAFNQSCISNPNCYQNATYCSSAGCCAEKICHQNQDCYLSIPECILSDEKEKNEGALEEDSSIVDEEACLFDDNCRRSVTYCVYDGCCAVKQCFGNEFCALSEPLCFQAATREDITGTENEATSPIPNNLEDIHCINNPNCKRNATFCISKGCCAFKFCDDFGLCSVQLQKCVSPQLTHEQAVNLTCIRDPFCYRDANFCLYESCCAAKTCDESGNCSVKISSCLSTRRANQGAERPL